MLQQHETPIIRQLDVVCPYNVSNTPLIINSINNNVDIDNPKFLGIFGGCNDGETCLIRLKQRRRLVTNNIINNHNSSNVNSSNIEFIKDESMDLADIGLTNGEFVTSFGFHNHIQYNQVRYHMGQTSQNY